MARAARSARREARRLGLLTLLATACAVIQEPPGGPPDFTPPVVQRVTPDSGAVVTGMRGSARIEFDEVIDERSGGGLDRLVLLSPRPRELDINWARTAIEVKPKEGWRPNTVYQLTLLPGIQDLRSNRLDSGKTVVFSTGGAIPDTRLSGTVLDWEQQRAGRGALIEALLLPDSLTYLGRADSVGDYVLRQLPLGRYVVYSTLDQNNNQQREFTELYDSTVITLDSVATAILWAATRDTVGPAVRGMRALDSLRVQVEFSRRLLPSALDSARVEVFLLPDTVAVQVARVWRPEQWDSVRAARDTTRRAAPADTAPPRRDTTAAQRDTTVTARRDTSAARRLLPTRPPLPQALIVQLVAPLQAGQRYLIHCIVVSVAGRRGDSRSVLVVPAARDST